MSEFLIPALKIVCTFQGLAVIFLGALFGILCGAMPGLSAIMAMTILMPFTFSLDGLYGILMLLGVFCGAVYGGSITAILINTPGTANAAATCLDGYPMAQKGHPDRAISISYLRILLRWPVRLCLPAVHSAAAGKGHYALRRVRVFCPGGIWTEYRNRCLLQVHCKGHYRRTAWTVPGNGWHGYPVRYLPVYFQRYVFGGRHFLCPSADWLVRAGAVLYHLRG